MSDTVERIVDLVAASGVRSVTVSTPGFRVTVRRRSPCARPHAADSGGAWTDAQGRKHAPQPGSRGQSPADGGEPIAGHSIGIGLSPAEAYPPGQTIRSQRVGVFHHLEPKAEAGQVVQAGQSLGVIESMKIPSDVRSHCDGVIAGVLIEEGTAVEFDQPLFVLSGLKAHGTEEPA